MKDFEYPNNRTCCSRCGRKEFYENKIASKVERNLMCHCKGCGDLHKFTSRIGLSEWRRNLIKIILEDGSLGEITGVHDV